MAVVTIRGKKKFSWSYSKLKNFETCPKKYHAVDVSKTFKEGESETLTWGNEVHKHLANRIEKKIELPNGMKSFEKWVEPIVTTPGKILVEQKLSITEEFTACGFFDADVWFRGIGDVIKVVGPVALVVDWKTGKILDDSQQLALMAACVFAQYPEVQRVRSEFIWLKEDATTREDFKREDMHKMWGSLWPRIKQLENAHEKMDFPPKPSGLCRRYCPVTSCPHNGT
jgi:hypothetical protein